MNGTGSTPSGKTSPTGFAAEPEGGRVAPPRATDFAFTLGKSRLDTMSWLIENPEALREYAGKWVVAADRRVWFSGDAPGELIMKSEDAGLSRSDIVLDFVEDLGRVY